MRYTWALRNYLLLTTHTQDFSSNHKSVRTSFDKILSSFSTKNIPDIPSIVHQYVDESISETHKKVQCFHDVQKKIGSVYHSFEN